MTEEKWRDTIARIKDNKDLTITQQEVVDLPEEEGGGTVEIVEFNGPMGLMRLEYEVKPMVEDTKTLGANRIGSHKEVKYIYSATEKVRKMYVYRFDQQADDWAMVQLERDSLF